MNRNTGKELESGPPWDSLQQMAFETESCEDLEHLEHMVEQLRSALGGPEPTSSRPVWGEAQPSSLEAPDW